MSQRPKSTRSNSCPTPDETAQCGESLTVILNNRWDVNLDATLSRRLATRARENFRYRNATHRRQPGRLLGNDRARSHRRGVRRHHLHGRSGQPTADGGTTPSPCPHQTFPAAIAFGEYLPDRVVRGIVLARLTNFLEGHAATTPRIAQAVAAMLDGAPMPPIAAAGQGGAGEILALYPLFAQLSTAFELEVKERGSLINGSPCAAALIADSAIAAQRRLRLAFKTFALSIEAFRAPLEHYDAALDSLWGDKDDSRGAAGVAGLSSGVGLGPRPAATIRRRSAIASCRAVLGTPIAPRPRHSMPPPCPSPRSADNPVYCRRTSSTPTAAPSAPAVITMPMATPRTRRSRRHLGRHLPALRSAQRQALERPRLANAGPVAHRAPAGPRATAAATSAMCPMAAAGYIEMAKSAAQRTFIPGS